MDQFKWVDVKGNQHSLTGNTCNTQIPAWTEQVNTITDKNSLPITKVMYGPMVHDAQSAKIIIGPIICYILHRIANSLKIISSVDLAQ